MSEYETVLGACIRQLRRSASSTCRSAEAVFLTGSFAQGCPVLMPGASGWTPRSDVDLLVLTERPSEGKDLADDLRMRGFTPSVHATTVSSFISWQASQFTWELAHTGVDLLAGDSDPVEPITEALTRFRDYLPARVDSARLLVNRYAEMRLSNGGPTAIMKLSRAVVDALLMDAQGLPPRVRDRPSTAARLLSVEHHSLVSAYESFVREPWTLAGHDDEAVRTAMRYGISLLGLWLGPEDAPRSWLTEARRQAQAVTRYCWTPTTNIDRATHNRLVGHLTTWTLPRKATLERWALVHGH